MKKLGVLVAFIAMLAGTSATSADHSGKWIKYKVMHNGNQLLVNPDGLHGHLQHGDRFLGVVVRDKNN